MNKGYIYSLTCKNINLVYYGSTTTTLNRRFSCHKSSKNKCQSKILFQWGDVKINLIEEIFFDDKKELLEREKYYIDNLECINILKPIVSKEESKKNKKRYHELNKEILNEKQKQYREANKEIIKEKKKQYREANKEIINEKHKQYREANKEIISERRKKNITCQCGSIFRKGELSRHNKTKKHNEFVQNKNILNL